jgi:hypothetical protein
VKRRIIRIRIQYLINPGVRFIEFLPLCEKVRRPFRAAKLTLSTFRRFPNSTGFVRFFQIEEKRGYCAVDGSFGAVHVQLKSCARRRNFQLFLRRPHNSSMHLRSATSEICLLANLCEQCWRIVIVRCSLTQTLEEFTRERSGTFRVTTSQRDLYFH